MDIFRFLRPCHGAVSQSGHHEGGPCLFTIYKMYQKVNCWYSMPPLLTLKMLHTIPNLSCLFLGKRTHFLAKHWDEPIINFIFWKLLKIHGAERPYWWSCWLVFWQLANSFKIKGIVLFCFVFIEGGGKLYILRSSLMCTSTTLKLPVYPRYTELY